jgi:hypothetical protein
MPKEENIERCMGNKNIYKIITFQNFAIPLVPLNIALVGLQAEHKKLSWSSRW